MDRRDALRRRTRSGLFGRGPLWPWLVVLAAAPLGLLAGGLLRPEPARPVLSADKIDFGTLRPGEMLERVLTLRNAGEAELRVQAARLADVSAVKILDDGCSGRSLVGGGECKLRLAFSPAIDGEFFSKIGLRLASGGEAMPDLPEIPVFGRAASSRLEMSPGTADFGAAAFDTVSFGTVMVGQWGPRHAVELASTGTAPLHVRSVSLQGLASADFVRADGDCTGRDLEPGSTCSVSFDFVPTTEGERRADLVVESDADSTGALPELVGIGILPKPGLAVRPILVDFGPLRADDGGRSRGVARDLRLENDGDAVLRLLDVRLTRSDAGFRLDASDCARGTLDPGAGCRVRITFAPRAEGETTSVVEIQHDAEGGAKRIPLTGIGTRPRLAVSDSPLFLGRVALGKVGEWRELELRNAGTADLSIRSLYLDGLDRRSFEMVADGCRGVIPPGTSCTAQFRIVPRREGPQRVEVVIEHDGPGERATVTVNGLGVSR